APVTYAQWGVVANNDTRHAAASAANLLDTLARARGAPLVVLLSGHPDPDSIGSALAHRRICEHVGVEATIAHVQPVSRLENRALVKLLGVELLRVQSTSDLERFRYLSLVDTSSPDPSIALPDGLAMISIVDHHRWPSSDAPYKDLRPELGATATVYAQYFEGGLVPFGAHSREDTLVATALLSGIRSDTDDYFLATPADLRAAAYLKPLADMSILRRLGRRVISAASMDTLARALADLEIVRDFALAGAGLVSVGNRDSIGETADFILRREDIDTVLVYGVVGDRIDGSLRTVSPSVDPAHFLDTAFGRDGGGRPYGGGRADKGGFQVPLGLFAQAGDDAGLWQLARRAVRACVGRAVPGLS
ncbi:MAG: DHH family phosphoesterase, partial [Deltaproteobacteria bacterium]|nr:DHH family phosphoesterase [Deltaproteobacteria bacterium]